MSIDRPAPFAESSMMMVEISYEADSLSELCKLKQRARDRVLHSDYITWLYKAQLVREWTRHSIHFLISLLLSEVNDIVRLFIHSEVPLVVTYRVAGPNGTIQPFADAQSHHRRFSSYHKVPCLPPPDQCNCDAEAKWTTYILLGFQVAHIPPSMVLIFYTRALFWLQRIVLWLRVN